jgi:phasin family protein
MTQPNKKPTLAQPTAKLASAVANKTAKSAFAAVESTRNSAENVVKIGTNAVKEFFSTSAEEAQKAHEKAFAMSRENAEHLTKSADTITKALYEAIAVSRDNIEACIECGNVTASLAKDISAEAIETANKAFSDNVELSKEVFACRTINDMMELQSKIVKGAIDQFFNQSVKLSGKIFEYSSEAMEPINERVAQASEQLSKVLAA